MRNKKAQPQTNFQRKWNRDLSKTLDGLRRLRGIEEATYSYLSSKPSTVERLPIRIVPGPKETIG
jgi:hypothetical protein